MKFGSPKYLLTGKSEDEDEFNRVEENFFGITQRSKQFKLCCVECDMLTALEIPRLVDSTASDLSLKWVGELKCLLDSYGCITNEDVQEWVKGTFRHGSNRKKLRIRLDS